MFFIANSVVIKVIKVDSYYHGTKEKTEFSQRSDVLKYTFNIQHQCSRASAVSVGEGNETLERKRRMENIYQGPERKRSKDSFELASSLQVSPLQINNPSGSSLRQSSQFSINWPWQSGHDNWGSVTAIISNIIYNCDIDWNFMSPTTMYFNRWHFEPVQTL